MNTTEASSVEGRKAKTELLDLLSLTPRFSEVPARHIGLRTVSTVSRFALRRAFTLIELLVVIAIMAILAALIIPITSKVSAMKLRSRTKTELKSIETAIIDYKTRRGYYPPDSDPKYLLYQLYYELSGTTLNNGLYTTLDGAGVLDPNQVPAIYFGPGQKAIVNTTKGGGGDEGMAAQKFIRELKPGQVASLNTTPPIKILVASVGWEGPTPLVPSVLTSQPKLDPIRYISTNPTNNPNSFDLWVDIIVQGKTNRICNWSEDPIILQ